MSETRKLQSIDGGEGNEDEQVALNHEPEFRSSKSNLSKSKEKVSIDGAEEKLLSKEEEAKIVTRVDMADAKYHHSNGDTKIELDANKRQFSGLTKEELLKYADDPFWVNLRWFMFVLFWALWLCMLAGAIAIIVKAPKCAPPTPRTWYEKGPLVDFDIDPTTLEDIESELPLLQSASVQGIFVKAPSYEVLDKPDLLEQYKSFIEKAKEYGVKVIVDLIPNFVSIDHPWFEMSVNRTGEYNDYFVWAPVDKYEDSKPKPPNNWISTLNESAWTYNEQRKEFYLHQYAADQPDLNFNNEKVVQRFASVIGVWMSAGAYGVRLSHAREMLVNLSLADEAPAPGREAAGADHTQRAFWTHRHIADQPQLAGILANYSQIVDQARSDEGGVFTLREESGRVELFTVQQAALRPPSAAPLHVSQPAQAAVHLAKRLARGQWPAVQLIAEEGGEKEIASFAMLLPAAPVLHISQLKNDSGAINSELSHVIPLRNDASIEHGAHVLTAVSARNSTDNALLACARWKSGHTGYVAVYNPQLTALSADLSPLSSVPDTLTLPHVTQAVKLYTNYTSHVPIDSTDVLVPPKSTLVLSYVPKTIAED